ncbi:very short patch repair endonuclease [Brevibacterium sp. K72]|uniref:very short patch repair endonuclease n=1 Tax=Brevibacterium sp. K72 TaxID=3390729 RepID=UPI003D2FAB45
MAANRGRDTKPELRIRSALHRRGMRFRVDVAPLNQLRRRADIVMTKARIAVFVDGCFWHGCPDHFVQPRTNAEFWREKIQRNRTRDWDTDQRLEQAGWKVLRFWEHEDPDVAVSIIIASWRLRVNGLSA